MADERSSELMIDRPGRPDGHGGDVEPGLAGAKRLTGPVVLVLDDLALAMIGLERHDLDGVEAALKHGSDANLRDPEAAQQVALRIAYARLLLGKGSRDAAAAVLERIRRETGAPALPPVLVRWLALAEAEVDLVASRPRRVGTPLSSRELEVLRYLPTVLNAAEIADELHISVNTIKAHMRSIYSKLDASRRREAVIHAREAGFIR